MGVEGEVRKWGFVREIFEMGKVFLVLPVEKLWGGNSLITTSYTTDLLSIRQTAD